MFQILKVLTFAIQLLCKAEANSLIDTSRRRVERPQMGYLKECCSTDYPHCSAKNKNPFSIDAAVFDPKLEGEEILYTFYGDHVFMFSFKDEARTTPSLEQSKDNKFQWRTEFNQDRNMEQIVTAFHYGEQNIVLQVKGKDREKLKAVEAGTRNSIQDPSEQEHPWLKQNDAGKMYAAAYMRAHGANGSLLAFYRQEQANINEPFEYTVKLWDLEYKRLENSAKFTGRIIAAAGRRLLGVKGAEVPPSRGIYFTNDGRACEFELKLPDPKLGETDLNIERTQGGLSPPCSSFQVFLGCPVSYCYQGHVDDISYHQGQYFIFWEKFFYTVKGEKHDLPMAAPRTKDAQFVEPNGFPYEQGLELVDAAFHYEEEGKQIMVTIKEDIVKYYVDGTLPPTDSDTLMDIFKGAPGDVLVDTAIYNGRAEKLMMFFGETWGYFTRRANTANEWQLEGQLRNKTSDFKEVPIYFEGSIDTKDHIYFTVGSHYYRLRQSQEPAQQVLQAYSSVVKSKDNTGIFHQQDCELPEMYSNLAERHNLFQPFKYTFVPRVEEEDVTQASGFVDLFLVILGTILVVAFVLLLGAFFLLGKRKHKKGARGKRKVALRTKDKGAKTK